MVISVSSKVETSDWSDGTVSDKLLLGPGDAGRPMMIKIIAGLFQSKYILLRIDDSAL